MSGHCVKFAKLQFLSFNSTNREDQKTHKPQCTTRNTLYYVAGAKTSSDFTSIKLN